MQPLNELPEIFHRFVFFLACVFFLIVVLKATFDCKSISNFNQLHQRSFFGKSGSRMFFKIVVTRNLANLTRKHQYWSLFLITLQALSL